MYKVIIVDDERIIRAGIAKIIPWEENNLTLEGLAINGKEGLEMIREKLPDIAIVDIKMPILSGIELIAQVRKEKLNTEFIILSGHDEFDYARTAMNYGVKHYILKPTEKSLILMI